MSGGGQSQSRSGSGGRYLNFVVKIFIIKYYNFYNVVFGGWGAGGFF
jgi:hypothetical protein